MEHGKLEREIWIEASPEVVFDVVSLPEHISMWWPDEATLERSPGAVGQLTWNAGHQAVITVVEVDPPHTFSFRWVAPDGDPADASNSLLVTFELVPSGSGTLLRLAETGWREKGWEAAVLEEAFRDHERGWDLFLPRLQRYASTVIAR